MRPGTSCTTAKNLFSAGINLLILIGFGAFLLNRKQETEKEEQAELVEREQEQSAAAGKGWSAIGFIPVSLSIVNAAA